jgi:hypothetical protein
MIYQITNQALQTRKNILILGSPRSGTHALASLIYHQAPSFQYLGEICKSTDHRYPWHEIDRMMTTSPLRIAHIVQTFSKTFLISKVNQIHENNICVSLRRRDKVKQFASWMFFKHIGFIYNFDHKTIDYVAPGSIKVTVDDIQNFVIDQIIDNHFHCDFTLYYEDIDFQQSSFKKNQYAYPIEQVLENFDMVKEYLQDWTYD